MPVALSRRELCYAWSMLVRGPMKLYLCLMNREGNVWEYAVPQPAELKTGVTGREGHLQARRGTASRRSPGGANPPNRKCSCPSS